MFRYYLYRVQIMLLLQWNLYKATNKLCGLSRQVVSDNMENKHDILKTVPGKWQNLCAFSKTSQSHYTGSAVLRRSYYVLHITRWRWTFWIKLIIKKQ